MRHLQVLYSVLHLQDKYRVRLNNTVLQEMAYPLNPQLRLAGCELAEEIRSGQWDHIKGLKTGSAARCVELTDALSEHCPGFTLEEYQEAIGNGLFETR